MSTDTTRGRAAKEAFSGRTMFIFAAIGSAVGLGNIWRFPFVAYDNGGGAFLIPYLVALLSAGIPLLFFDYAIGHRFRGSALTVEYGVRPARRRMVVEAPRQVLDVLGAHRTSRG